MPEIFFADSFIYSSNLQFISAESSNIPFFHSQTTKYIESQLHSTYERDVVKWLGINNFLKKLGILCLSS